MEPVETYHVGDQGMRLDIYEDRRIKLSVRNPRIEDQHDFMSVWLPEEHSEIILSAGDAINGEDRHKAIIGLCSLFLLPMSAFTMGLALGLQDLARGNVQGGKRRMDKLTQEIARAVK